MKLSVDSGRSLETSGTAVQSLKPRYYLALLLPKAGRQGVN